MAREARRPLTITLSAADATAHIVENPWAPAALQHRVGLTLLLIAFLGAFSIRGFHEAIGLAVILVAVYLALNVVVILTDSRGRRTEQCKLDPHA